MRSHFVSIGIAAMSFVAVTGLSAADEPASVASHLAQLAREPIAPADSRKVLAVLLARQAGAELQAANLRETEAWRRIQSRDQWQVYRDSRIAALRAALGSLPPAPDRLNIQVTGRLEGPGYRIENLVFESSPGLLVTANLYQPADPPASMPGILLCHSHHGPKSDEELQDMGISWAQRGCLVLAMDLLGHGERRQHPFATRNDYPEPFKVGRQDYYFRYNVGFHLALIGQSLSGWIAADLMRGVDLLLNRPGIDKDRIILLGSVAGGGDLAAVAAALDERITAVAVFNFGGPQPETRYPLPDHAEEWFNYAGGGSWESTRNLPFSACDGFLPWAIVGSVAPRRLIYGHEFSWDQEHDPVWSRLEKIYDFYDARLNLVGVHGRGGLSGRPPEASHCNNIGPLQLAGVHAALETWFGIAHPKNVDHKNYSAAKLICLTPDVARQHTSKSVCELASQIGAAKAHAVRDELTKLPADRRRKLLQELWTKVLGSSEPSSEMKIESVSKTGGKFLTERVLLHLQPDLQLADRPVIDLVVPVLLLSPAASATDPRPVVVGIAQQGHGAFLEQRAGAITELLAAGVVVCLADLRGTGDTRPVDPSRSRTSESTDLSASFLMLGRPLLGSRLADLRSVLAYLRRRDGVDGERMALWGESFAASNPPGQRLDVPLGVDPSPSQSEPLGPIAALLAALYEPDVRAVYASGGLSSYLSVLESPFCYLPHDVVVPGIFGAGDLCDVAAALAPRPLRLTRLVDGRNRLVSRAGLDQIYASAAFVAADAAGHIEIDAVDDDRALAEWLLKRLTAP